MKTAIAGVVRVAAADGQVAPAPTNTAQAPASAQVPATERGSEATVRETSETVTARRLRRLQLKAVRVSVDWEFLGQGARGSGTPSCSR